MKTRGRAIRRALPDLAVHARHWLWNALRIGRGAELLLAALENGGLPPEAAVGPRGDGFVPLRAGKPPLAGAELERYRSELAAMPAGARRLSHGDSESQAELLPQARPRRALRRRARARRAARRRPHLRAGAAAADLVFLDFADPARFPELFAPEHRADSGHLNARGAEIYSRLVGRALGAVIAGRPG